MQNKKGIQMSLSTILVVSVVLLALGAFFIYFRYGFGTGKAGFDLVLGGARESAEGEEGLLEQMHRTQYDGACVGDVLEIKCGCYYESGLRESGLSYSWCVETRCEVPSCNLVGGYPVHSWFESDSDECSGYEGYGGCVGSSTCNYQGYWSSRCRSHTCSDLTEHGQELCECAGCVWEPLQ